ncbi:MAG: trypsin-like peptidase domain-containing protein [Limnochordia bacterium]|nr:trypsin-like peptidase domain-containing protein [Limnochordia bacterium]MDD2628844.1 trypsin-like peptidase domain-containing protein [Limnochordia bacterium]MDD4517439.1 trypsin-like peptidase domain-containing protein [Limnochordia bacterium]
MSGRSTSERRLIIALSVMVVLSVATGVVLGSFLHAKWPWTSIDEGHLAGQATGGEDPTVAVVEQVGPAVVKIVTTRDLILDNFFFQIVEEREGIGSGVIVDKEGTILTNNHVIADAKEITVFLPDGRSFQGEVIGRDEFSDLAVVQIQGDNLPTATLGSSGDLRVGEAVIAIGNPFRFDNSVTTGVVSALGRDITIDPRSGLDLQNMIQTDASINPGNSGGALLNTRGEVIGINTAIYQPGQGIGFAIPIDSAKDVMEQLKQYGRVARLGALGGTLTPEIAKELGQRLGYEVPSKGAYILSVREGSPAAEAGITSGDTVISVNGTPISTMDELVKKVRSHAPGDKLRIALIKEGVRRETTVTL